MKFGYGGCCCGGCGVRQWNTPESVKQDFYIIGSQDARDAFAEHGRIMPGATLISRKPLIDPAAWLWNMPIIVDGNSGIAVRWIAHATPTISPNDDEEEETEDPNDYEDALGDHIFGELRFASAEYQEPWVLRSSLGTVIGGYENIIDTTHYSTAWAALEQGEYAAIGYSEAPLDGRVLRRVTVSRKTGDSPLTVATLWNTGYSNTNHDDYGASNGSMNGPGSFFVFTAPCRVYANASPVDPDTTPYIEIGAGQALRAWGETWDQVRDIDNYTVVDLDSIDVTRRLTFNRSRPSTGATPIAGLGITAIGSSLPSTLPSGGHVGVQVIATELAPMEVKPATWAELPAAYNPYSGRPTRPRVTRVQTRFSPTCEPLENVRYCPCPDEQEFTEYATIDSDFDASVFAAIAGELSTYMIGGPAGEPVFVDVQQAVPWFEPWGAKNFGYPGSFNLGGIYRHITQWATVSVRLELYARVSLHRDTVRPDGIVVAVSANLSAVLTYADSTQEMFAYALPQDALPQSGAGPGLFTSWEYMRLPAAGFDCTSFALSIELDPTEHAISRGAGAAIAGKKITLRSL